MTSEIITAFLLGLVAGIVPGPILTATFTEILQSGLWKSIRIIILAMLAETAVALLTLLALSSMNLPEGIFRGLSLIGAVILVWISGSLWKVRKIDIDEKINFSLGKIIALTIANGLLWTFWITVCVPKALSLNEKIAFGSYLFLFLVEIGWLISTFLAAFVFSRFRDVLSNPKVVPVVFKILALMFIYFAGDMAFKSFRYFIPWN